MSFWPFVTFPIFLVSAQNSYALKSKVKVANRLDKGQDYKDSAGPVLKYLVLKLSFIQFWYNYFVFTPDRPACFLHFVDQLTETMLAQWLSTFGNSPQPLYNIVRLIYNVTGLPSGLRVLAWSAGVLGSSPGQVVLFPSMTFDGSVLELRSAKGFFISYRLTAYGSEVNLLKQGEIVTGLPKQWPHSSVVRVLARSARVPGFESRSGRVMCFFLPCM